MSFFFAWDWGNPNSFNSVTYFYLATYSGNVIKATFFQQFPPAIQIDNFADMYRDPEHHKAIMRIPSDPKIPKDIPKTYKVCIFKKELAFLSINLEKAQICLINSSFYLFTFLGAVVFIFFLQWYSLFKSNVK